MRADDLRVGHAHGVGSRVVRFFSALLMFFSGNDPLDAVQRGARGMGVDVLPVLPVIVLLRAVRWAPSQADGCAQPPANPALAPPPDHLPAHCRRLAD